MGDNCQARWKQRMTTWVASGMGAVSLGSKSALSLKLSFNTENWSVDSHSGQQNP